MSNNRSGAALKLEHAQYEVEQAKKRLSSDLGALQSRLKPGTLVSQAWDGVRDKSSDAADEAIHVVNEFADGAAEAVRSRPMAASGVAAAVLLFLARGPLKRAAYRIFRGGQDEGVIKTDLADSDENYDLTAPSLDRPVKQGASA